MIRRKLKTATGLVKGYIQSQDDLWGRYVELRGNVVEIGGLRFSVNSPAIRTRDKARFLFDRYERPERIIVADYLASSLPVIELGGNIGVVSCVANRRLTDPSKHVVVEANANVLPLLEANRERNSCAFKVVHAALGYGETVDFFVSDDALASSAVASAERLVKVPATSLRKLIDDAGFSPCTLLCDIEGSEAEMVTNELDTLVQHVAYFFLETHAKIVGPESVAAMLDRLTRAGFKTLFSRWSNVALVNTALVPQ